MKRNYTNNSTRSERRDRTSTARKRAAAHKARYAEELAEVESAVSRAALLMRCEVKKAA